jgi:ribosomal protein S12 methylthiotransferase accessory factor
MLACMGEACERYCAGYVSPGVVVRRRANELDGEYIDPDDLAPFHQDQRNGLRRIPFPKWRETGILGWVKANSLPDGRAVWVPAAAVFLPYNPQPEEIVPFPTLSTGLACGPTEDQARATAICEVVERDAVALAWLGNIVPRAASAESLDEDTARLLALVRQYSASAAILDLTTDLGIPVRAALLDAHSPLGHITGVGSACRPNPGAALKNALCEAAHCRMYVKSMMAQRPAWSPSRGYRNVVSFADHALTHSVCPAARRALAKWRAPRPSVPDTLPTRELACGTSSDLVSILNSKGFRVLAINLTTRDVAGVGLSVVRVIVPGLQPLQGNHNWPYLGGRRLARVHEIFRQPMPESFRINTVPHPSA